MDFAHSQIYSSGSLDMEWPSCIFVDSNHKITQMLKKKERAKNRIAS